MRNLIVQEFVSLDGFAAGPNGEIDFFASMGDRPREQDDRDAIDIMGNVDTILLGSVTYAMFAEFWPSATTDTEPIADAINTTRKIVFSNRLASAPWGSWNEAEVRRGDAATEVAELKRQPGKDLILWGSLTLAASLFRAGLVDEVQLRVVPVAIGRGRQLFPDDIGQLSMKLVGATPYPSEMVLLRYELPAGVAQ